MSFIIHVPAELSMKGSAENERALSQYQKCFDYCLSVMVVLHQGSLNGLDTDLVAYLALPCIGNFFLTQLTFSKQTTSLISKFLSEGVHPAKSSL